MNKTLKKIIALVAVAVILAASVPFGGFVGIGDSFLPVAQAETAELTEGYFTYEIDGNNDAIIVRCDKTISGEVVVPSNINGYTVTTIGGFAFQNCDNITKITVPNSVTFIGEYAFCECDNLAEAVISKNVISIEPGTFEGCYSLQEVTLPKNLLYIGYYAFEWCNSLANIDLPDDLTSIGMSAFNGCQALTSIEIPASVTTIEASAFYNCTALTSITVADGNSNYVSDDYGVLFNKDKTTLIAYPVGNTRASYIIPYGVSEIGENAFYSAYNLTDVTIPESVVTVGNAAFYCCYGVKELPDSIETPP